MTTHDSIRGAESGRRSLRMTGRPQPSVKAAPAGVLTPLQQWEVLCKSDAFQAGLAAPKPEVPPQILRVVAQMLRPGLAALKGLREEAASLTPAGREPAPAE